MIYGDKRNSIQSLLQIFIEIEEIEKYYLKSNNSSKLAKLMKEVFVGAVQNAKIENPRILNPISSKFRWTTRKNQK